MINTPTFDICDDYHTYAFEWTPDYIAWFIDGAQIRKVTGASVTEYTQNASQGMSIHFNVWAGRLELRRKPQHVDAARVPVHKLGPVLVVRQRRVPDAMARGVQRFDDAERLGARGPGRSPLNHSTHNRGQREVRERDRRARA